MASFNPSRYAAASSTPYVYMVISPRYGIVHGNSISLGYMRPYPEHIENHDSGADRNRGVRDVEGPEVVRAPVHVDEIDDRAGGDAIDQVPGGAADDQRQPGPRHGLFARQAGRVHGDAGKSSD